MRSTLWPGVLATQGSLILTPLVKFLALSFGFPFPAAVAATPTNNGSRPISMRGMVLSSHKPELNIFHFIVIIIQSFFIDVYIQNLCSIFYQTILYRVTLYSVLNCHLNNITEYNDFLILKLPCVGLLCSIQYH